MHQAIIGVFFRPWLQGDSASLRLCSVDLLVVGDAYRSLLSIIRDVTIFGGVYNPRLPTSTPVTRVAKILGSYKGSVRG